MRDLFKTIELSHLPTWFFIIGYPVFWLEMGSPHARTGMTSRSAWILFAAVAALALRQGLKMPRPGRIIWSFWNSNPRPSQFLWASGAAVSAVILIVAALAAGQPIHLMQETDCMHYHYSLPRQHLILGSLAHIPWSGYDLFVLPVDFALAPFWFATGLPNKLPQFLIMLGLIAVGARLTAALAGPSKPWAPAVFVLAFCGTHGFGIQMGTGMLDLTLAYLFFAAIDSLRTGRWVMAAIEFAFFFWAKPFLPLLMILGALLLALLWLAARSLRFEATDGLNMLPWRLAVFTFCLLSVPVAGPFIAKSLHYTATPLFPFVPGIIGHAPGSADPAAWRFVEEFSRFCTGEIRNGYGHGRDIISFFRFLWLAAVPEKGVNNSFDYPLGLTYLLFAGPFVWYTVKQALRRRFSWPGFFVLILFALWWPSSQQSRFLFIPILIMFGLAISRLARTGHVLLLCLTAALFMNAISIYNAHKRDLGRPAVDVLRPQDRALLEMSRAKDLPSADFLTWPSEEVAYAQFPVQVEKE